MINLSAETRARRLNKAVDPYKEISVRAYNLILIGTVLYGLAINALLCRESIVYFMYERVHPAVFFIVYIVCVIAGVLIANKSDNPVISFLGYNLIVVPMGIVVGEAVILGGYSPSVVWHACITTAGMTVIMAAAGLLFPQFFSKLGSILLFGLIGLLIGFLLSIFLPGFNLVVTLLAAVLFSLYIGYDVYRSQQFPRTVDNAIDCAIDIYVDLINLFLNLLRIFGKSNDS